MREPCWEALRDELMGWRVKELRSLGKRWFNGSLGGASSKRQIVDGMVTQMRHWWLRCEEMGGRERVANVVAYVREADAR